MNEESSNTDIDNVETKRKARVDSIELRQRQKQFVENYLFNENNGINAYMQAYERAN